MQFARHEDGSEINSKNRYELQPLPVMRKDASSIYYRGPIPGVHKSTRERGRIRRKIKIPTHNGFNYAGLIIGPKGSNQKRLEKETGCKVLVRGRGSQKEGMPSGRGDFEDLHVLIAGDREEMVERALEDVKKILYADEKTLTLIRLLIIFFDFTKTTKFFDSNLSF